MKKWYIFFAILTTLSFFVVSCSTVPGTKALSNQSHTQAQSSNNTLNQASVTSMPTSAQTNNIENEKALLEEEKEILQRIYFNVNSSTITNVDKWNIEQNPKEVLNKIAEFLIQHPNIKIKIEGNCDERGTDSYNLALGQQRADAAKNYLILKGVNPQNIETISNGKFKPIDPAHNEYAWAKNRNDEFVVISQ